MKKILFIFLSVLSGLTALAQNRYSIKGVVTDAESGIAVSRVHVETEDQSNKVVTDVFGTFQLDGSGELPTTLHLSHVSYRDTSITLEFASDRAVFLNVELKRAVYFVPAATVQDQKPDTVFGSDEFHVADYTFDQNGQLLILTYENQKYLKRSEESEINLYDGCKIILLDSTGNSVSSYSLSSQCIGFKTDFRQFPYLECKDKLYRISIDKKAEIDLERIDKEDFKEYIAPIIDSLNTLLYYSNRTPSFPAFEYYALDMKDSSHHQLASVEDELQMKMLRASYRDLKGRDKLKAFRTELETGIDKEIIGGYMAGHPQSIYYEETFAPLFVRRDTVLIFDYCSDRLLKFDETMQVLDSVDISHHKNYSEKWRDQLVMDYQDLTIYAVYEKHGYIFLKNIDPSCGTVLFNFKLEHRYPENISVRGGEVFYTYRPFGSIQKKFLYSEVIPNY